MTLSALHTDLYELTMLAGYYEKGMHEKPAAFDLFFRENPFRGGYAVFAGLQPALDYLENLRFRDEEIRYLDQLGIFRRSFLDYLATFHFTGSVKAPREGTVVFPNEPLLTVEGGLAEAQFVETALLNIVNFQTLAATKAARITRAAGNSEVIEFGLRRSQGPDGGLGLARAAAVGGVLSTSNVLAGQVFGLPVKGTHAHSWVMSFPDELSAFRAYADVFPDSCVLLVDTYDTLDSGLENALTVAGELEEKGKKLRGIRLDSGDIAELSKEARKRLDRAGYDYVKIVASNELDEERISKILEAGGRVDAFGVGTRLATCAGDGGGALGGVYKLVRLDGRPRLKTTSDPDKGTLPDVKNIWRFKHSDGHFMGDLLCLDAEKKPDEKTILSLLNRPDNSRIQMEKIRDPVMQGGRRLHEPETLSTMADRCQDQMAALPESCKTFVPSETYPVHVSDALAALQRRLAGEHDS